MQKICITSIMAHAGKRREAQFQFSGETIKKLGVRPPAAPPHTPLLTHARALCEGKALTQGAALFLFKGDGVVSKGRSGQESYPRKQKRHECYNLTHLFLQTAGGRTIPSEVTGGAK